MDTVGNRLKALRKERQLTQQEVADMTGFIRATLANWELGRTEIDLNSVGKLAKFYRVSTDWIIYGNKLPIPHEPRYFDLGEVTIEEEYAKKGLSKEMIKHFLDAAVLAVAEARIKHNKPIK